VERNKLASALRQLVKGAFFDQDNEVGILSTGGLMLTITARQDGPAPRLLMLRRDGVMAMIQAGKLTIADAPSEIAAAGMTFLDAKTINDLVARLAEP
jgi:hypothetical protein